MSSINIYYSSFSSFVSLSLSLHLMCLMPHLLPLSLLLLFSHLSPLLSKFFHSHQSNHLTTAVGGWLFLHWKVWVCIVETSIVLGFNVSIMCTRVFFLCYWGSNKLEWNILKLDLLKNEWQRDEIVGSCSLVTNTPTPRFILNFTLATYFRNYHMLFELDAKKIL